MKVALIRLVLRSCIIVFVATGCVPFQPVPLDPKFFTGPPHKVGVALTEQPKLRFDGPNEWAHVPLIGRLATLDLSKLESLPDVFVERLSGHGVEARSLETDAVMRFKSLAKGPPDLVQCRALAKDAQVDAVILLSTRCGAVTVPDDRNIPIQGSCQIWGKLIDLSTGRVLWAATVNDSVPPAFPYLGFPIPTVGLDEITAAVVKAMDRAQGDIVAELFISMMSRGPSATKAKTVSDQALPSAGCPAEALQAAADLGLRPKGEAFLLAGPNVIIQDGGAEVRAGPVEVAAMISANGRGMPMRLSGAITMDDQGASFRFTRLKRESDGHEFPICATASVKDTGQQPVEPHPGYLFIATGSLRFELAL